MTEAVVAENVVKTYRIRRTQADAPTPRLRLAQFFFGESFKGQVEVTEKRVVDGLNLSVQEGEAVALLGPNGAGKSTFLEMVATGLTPESGTIRVMGYETVRERDKVKGFITPVFPMFGAQSLWTARQNLEYTALLYNISGAEMVRRMEHVLGVIGLESRADELVMRYSTGMRVRLILGMGLMVDQAVYLMDEPFIGIDPGIAREIRAFLKREVVGRGRTVLLATHVLDDVEQLCHKAALISEGRVVAADTLSRLKANIKGTETINLEVTGANGRAESLLRQLQDIEGARDAALSSSQDGASLYTVRTSDSRAFLPTLIDRIHQCGARVRYVRVTEPTMEDVFVHYTGRQLAEG
jgi:ABC-2 type transport system ATP-binding protein